MTRPNATRIKKGYPALRRPFFFRDTIIVITVQFPKARPRYVRGCDRFFICKFRPRNMNEGCTSPGSEGRTYKNLSHRYSIYQTRWYGRYVLLGTEGEMTRLGRPRSPFFVTFTHTPACPLLISSSRLTRRDERMSLRPNWYIRSDRVLLDCYLYGVFLRPLLALMLSETVKSYLCAGMVWTRRFRQIILPLKRLWLKVLYAV